MIAIVNSQRLAAELRLLCQVAPEKPAIAVVSHLLTEVSGNSLTFAATDLEVGLRSSCPATVVEEGACTLPARRLLSLVEQMPDGELRVEANEKQAAVSLGAFRSRLQVFPTDDFPRLPEPEGEVSELRGEALLAMVRKARYAINERSKYIINGALFSLTDTVSALVATDGKRLSLVTGLKAGGAIGQAILSAKVLEILVTVFGEGPLRFWRSNNHLFFADDKRLLFSRRAEGKFPSYDQIIPRDTDKRAVVSRQGLAAAIRRVGLLAEDNMALRLRLVEGGIALAASSHDAGDAVEQIEAAYVGDPVEVCCRWRHLLDFLEAAEGQVIEVRLKSATTPMLLSDGEHFINVVVLMRG